LPKNGHALDRRRQFLGADFPASFNAFKPMKRGILAGINALWKSLLKQS
jgi:hypothetical protein